MVGKGYVDFKDFAPRKTYSKLWDKKGPNVEINNVLPTICSKYKKDRNFSLDKMTNRDYKHLIYPSNGQFYSSEQKGYKPKVTGVPFGKMTARPPMVKANLEDGCGPSIYSYADSMKQALDKFGKKTGG